MTTLLMVGAGTMGRGYVRAARDLGLRVVLVERPSQRESYAPLVDGFVECPDPAEEAWLAAAWAAAETHRPDAALAFSEDQVLAAAWVQDGMGLPGPSLRAAQASRNKAIQRALLDGAGVGQPAHCLTASCETAADWADGRLPLVVKPLRGYGSEGVRLVRDMDSLHAAVAGHGGEPVLIEEYVSAQEYSWEGLVRDGVVLFGNYTEKRTSGAPQFVETGHLLPARLDDGTRKLLDEQIAMALNALHVRTSLVHLEFRAEQDRLWVMEAAVRTPGDHIMELLGIAYRRDVYSDVVRLAAGLPLDSEMPAHTTATEQYVTCPAGTIDAVSGVDEAALVPGVVRVGVELRPGERVGELNSSSDRVAFVIAQGADAEVSASKACDLIDVDVTPTD